MGFSSQMDGPAEGSGLTAVGETRLVPDLSTLRRIPWNKKDEMVLDDMCVKPGEAWEYCPRDVIRRASKILKDEFDLEMNAGFENEFILLKMLKRQFVKNVVKKYSGKIHCEAAKGQFEVVLKYTICTKAADNLIFTREVVRAIARKHGLLATFIQSKYALDDMGSGSHVHLSLWRNGQNVYMGSGTSSKHGISTLGREFMAGILQHLPSILAFIAPLPNSYDRLQPNTWSGAYLFWGNENKEAPLRASSPPGTLDGLATNFEMKSFDGSANPYLGLAAILAAGIDGLRRHLPLPEPVGKII
ncbi:type-1 glutamine synthetase 1-like [Vigna umbellata]|uniref:type-1 glutamine synthetase 1-like n=1 Tax=Vigna umbellata TaxID=87088 RepID=UPI001F5F04C0|nr:type-1 glutamine synthetase 1-like [Vigna umbellata]